MKIIEKFYDLQSQFTFVYHGIHLNRVMIFELHELAEGKPLWMNWQLSLLHLAMDFSHLKFESGNKILSTFGQQNRRDHREVYDFVLRQLGDSASQNDLRGYPLLRCFRPIVFIRCLCGVFGSLKNSGLSFRQKFNFSIYCAYYCNSIIELEKFDLSGVEKYLSMYNATQMENLITQYMKLKGIPTYSLCEGIYIVEKQNPTIDNVNHTNLETDHLLTWGQWVNDEFEKVGIHPERMTACGYPHLVELRKMNAESRLKRCMVLLARGTYHETNVRLLSILQKTVPEYEYSLKCHPNSDLAYYEDFASKNSMFFIPKEQTVNDCLDNEKYDFAIAVNTSAYYEALMRGVPCLRYTDGSFSLMKGYDDLFSSYEEYVFLLSKIKETLKGGSYQQEVDCMLEYVMGVGQDKYQEVLIG